MRFDALLMTRPKVLLRLRDQLCLTLYVSGWPLESDSFPVS